MYALKESVCSQTHQFSFTNIPHTVPPLTVQNKTNSMSQNSAGGGGGLKWFGWISRGISSGKKTAKLVPKLDESVGSFENTR